MYYIIPKGVFFNDTVTITAWFKLNEKCDKNKEQATWGKTQIFTIIVFFCESFNYKESREHRCEPVGIGMIFLINFLFTLFIIFFLI